MTITGYVLEVGDRILVNEKISREEFDTKTEQELHDEYYLTSIFFSINSIDSSVVSKLKVGQKVRIVIEGAIAESAPAQAKASKIEIVED
ncbi:YobA family protein [Bacillus sp. JJ1533]|uniref:YobA family protein n=1 Tax=Bacillus sp. JJ1533 TaxID=3122959 RepID=UPI002FFF89FA